MKKSWIAVIGMVLMLLMPGVATAADEITVTGQFEGFYTDNVYRFVTPDGQEIPAMMEHAGKIMSYTPFRATGYVAYNQAKQPILVIRNVSYQDRVPNQRTVSYRKDVKNLYPSQICRVFHGTGEKRSRQLVSGKSGRSENRGSGCLSGGMGSVRTSCRDKGLHGGQRFIQCRRRADEFPYGPREYNSCESQWCSCSYGATGNRSGNCFQPVSADSSVHEQRCILIG